jgi:hypothetical protein
MKLIGLVYTDLSSDYFDKSKRIRNYALKIRSFQRKQISKLNPLSTAASVSSALLF